MIARFRLFYFIILFRGLYTRTTHTWADGSRGAAEPSGARSRAAQVHTSRWPRRDTDLACSPPGRRCAGAADRISWQEPTFAARRPVGVGAVPAHTELLRRRVPCVPAQGGSAESKPTQTHSFCGTKVCGMAGAGAAATSSRGDGCPANADGPKKTKKKKSKEARPGVSAGLARSSRRGRLPLAVAGRRRPAQAGQGPDLRRRGRGARAAPLISRPTAVRRLSRVAARRPSTSRRRESDGGFFLRRSRAVAGAARGQPRGAAARARAERPSSAQSRSARRQRGRTPSAPPPSEPPARRRRRRRAPPPARRTMKQRAGAAAGAGSLGAPARPPEASPGCAAARRHDRHQT